MDFGNRLSEIRRKKATNAIRTSLIVCRKAESQGTTAHSGARSFVVRISRPRLNGEVSLEPPCKLYKWFDFYSGGNPGGGEPGDGGDGNPGDGEPGDGGGGDPGDGDPGDGVGVLLCSKCIIPSTLMYVVQQLINDVIRLKGLFLE